MRFSWLCPPVLVLLASTWPIPVHAVEAETRSEVGFIVGAGTLDKDLITGTGSVGEVVPLIGVRGAYRFGESLVWFGDASVARTSTELAPGDVEMVTARTGLVYLFNRDRRLRWFVSGAAGWADVDFEADLDFSRPLVSLGVGQRLQARRNAAFQWELRADRLVGEDGLSGLTVDGAQLLVGWSLGFGGGVGRSDADGDGVRDGRDLCAFTAPGARVDARGCTTDEDLDKVPDGIDRCPRTPALVRVDEVGCPVDGDGDGVPDGLDRCPATPSGASVNSEGCPSDGDRDGVTDGVDRCPGTPPWAQVDAIGCPLDSDGDGVPDGLDRCLDTPPGVGVDSIGCPEDEDRDGVPDGLDRCPDTPAEAEVDAEGCPEASPLVEALVGSRQPIVLEGVHFEPGRADLTPDSRTILRRLAETLRAASGLRVRIAGHTDSVGSAADNLALSRRRAEAVRDYLVRAGVSSSVLLAEGFGESRPIADNDTPEGRAQNRRVELSGVGDSNPER